VIDTLNWLRENRGLRLYAYCLMPDHLHLLVQAPQRLSEIVRSLKVETTRQYRRLGYTGKLWQDRYHDHIVRKAEDLEPIALYILGNPTRKGLAEDIVGYRWCGMPDPVPS